MPGHNWQKLFCCWTIVSELLWNVLTQYLAQICFIFRQVPGSCIRIGVVSRANEGAHVHLPKTSQGPPLNATYLPGPPSSSSSSPPSSSSLSSSSHVHFYQSPSLTAPQLMQPICLSDNQPSIILLQQLLYNGHRWYFINHTDVAHCLWSNWKEMPSNMVQPASRTSCGKWKRGKHFLKTGKIIKMITQVFSTIDKRGDAGHTVGLFDLGDPW